jgi:hypothetical protein
VIASGGLSFLPSTIYLTVIMLWFVSSRDSATEHAKLCRKWLQLDQVLVAKINLIA